MRSKRIRIRLATPPDLPLLGRKARGQRLANLIYKSYAALWALQVRVARMLKNFLEFSNTFNNPTDKVHIEPEKYIDVQINNVHYVTTTLDIFLGELIYDKTNNKNQLLKNFRAGLLTHRSKQRCNKIAP